MSNAKEILQTPNEQLSNAFFAGIVDQVRAFIEANDMSGEDRKMEFEIGGERYTLALTKSTSDNQ